MIVYNITTKVHTSIDHAWLQWQREAHIPDTMDTGLFESYSMFRLLEQDDEEGNTYAIQYSTADIKKYRLYIAEHASIMQQKAFDAWGDKTIAFRSLLEVIQ